MVASWNLILGQAEPQRRLKRLLAADRLPHALLFFGAAGVGKRLVAEALAAALLCESPQGAQACGACASCRALAGGSHPDFFAVEPTAVGKGARLIRIEAVREMTASLAQRPQLAGRQVVIVDEAERMNEAAANSFLKTLEEPTGDVVFILLTSARSALLPTIISRCVPMGFSPLGEAEILSVLRRHEVPPEEAAVLAALAGGSPGRALSLRASGALARRESAWEMLLRLPLLEPLDVWAAGEKLGALAREEAAEWLRFLRLLLRDRLVLDSGGRPIYSSDAPERLSALASCFSAAETLTMLAAIAETERRLRGSNANIRLLLEALLLRLSGAGEI